MRIQYVFYAHFMRIVLFTVKSLSNPMFSIKMNIAMRILCVSYAYLMRIVFICKMEG